MPIALRRPVKAAEPATAVRVWAQLGYFAAAGVFVLILAMTYGHDLSPGFF